MKKKKALFLGAIALAAICTACSDDDNDTISVSYPVELSVSFPEKNAGFQHDGWSTNAKLAAFRSDYRGLDKLILTQSGSYNSYSATSTDEIDEDTELAILYPSSASTIATSDTLTQVLYATGQDGTLKGLADFDYAWGTYVFDTSDDSYTESCEMTASMSLGKFRFTSEDNSPIEKISRILITSPSDSLYAEATLDLTEGDLSSKARGNVIFKNQQGISGDIYAAFFPTTTQLHFTVTTLDGKVYESSTTEEIQFVAGEAKEYATTPCTSLAPARIGDYFYNDATWSSELNREKKCVGIVFALEDENGNIDRTVSSSSHGRVVALEDRNSVIWNLSNVDVEGIDNQTVLQDTMYIGSLPYYNGKAGSFYSDEATERLSSIQINTETGQIINWYSQGVLSDFNGEQNASYINHNKSQYPAGSYSFLYREGLYGWYLPSAGELALLWTLHRTGIICQERQECFEDFEQFGYWTSSEYGETDAWYINFYSGMIAKNNKKSNYYLRPVIRF